MSTHAQNFPFSKQTGIYFDDFIVRNRWQLAQQMPAIHVGMMPPANVYETRDAFTIELVLPGVDPEQLDVELNGGQLIVTYAPAENTFEPINRKRTWRQEFRLPAFQRSFDVHPGVVIPESMEIFAENGLIHLVFAKRAELEGRMLPIVPFSLN